MPKRDQAPLGAPCWVDVLTTDVEGAQRFYGELFGWTAESTGEEFGGYVNFSKDGIRVAGAMANDGQAGFSDVWTVYLTTSDVKETADSAAGHGGQIVLPPMDVGDIGAMAYVSDPGGAAIGMWQPGTHKGFGILAEPGAPAWFELQTRDYDASVDFYRDVFGWDIHVVSDTPELRYTTQGGGDSMTAGIMDGTAYLPEAVPAGWSVYFGVTDADAALAQVVALGGTVAQAAKDTPYGRLAGAVDPTGAQFKLHQPT
ncbi:MAG: VOC family protein [Acidimicrobiales bacterium]